MSRHNPPNAVSHFGILSRRCLAEGLRVSAIWTRLEWQVLAVQRPSQTDPEQPVTPFKAAGRIISPGITGRKPLYPHWPTGPLFRR